MERLLEQLKVTHPALRFRAGEAFVWSPETQEIFYRRSASQESDTWSLLHETSHALLGHRTYSTDFELLKLEVDAWQKAKELARAFHITIDENHIQDCLDTYRDWLYARSICPRCGTKSIQQAELTQYRCFNCHEMWRVTPSRFCRAYRATKRGKSADAQAFNALAAI